MKDACSIECLRSPKNRFLKTEGKTTSQILAILCEDIIATTKPTVRRWMKRWDTHQGIEDNLRSGRPSRITEEINIFLNQCLKEDDERSSRELVYLVKRKFGINISSSAMRTHLRRKLQWIVVRTRLGPMISSANKVKRKEFALKCLQSGEQFEDVIWTDESAIHL